MKAPREEILRYLGSMGHEPDERLCTRIDDAVSAVTAAASPRSVFRRFGFDGSLIGTGYSPAGKDVLRQLDGCSAVYLFAATLGNGVERIEEQAFARGDSLGAVLLDAAASCLIESFCDDECERIARSEDVTLTSRFSCGYGDYPLEHQADIIRLLDAPKFGNHDPEADAMAQRLHGDLCRMIAGEAEKNGLYTYLPVLINNDHNVRFGKTTGATPDGRQAGRPLTNGNSPSDGADKKGLTALLLSMACMDNRLTAGMVQNVKLGKNLFASKEMLEKTEGLIEAVQDEIDRQLPLLPRADIARCSLENSKMILVRDLDEALALTNDYAPEHLVVALKNYEAVKDRIVHVGSVFLGNWSCESAGDYASGTNHTLPTKGYAKAYGGLCLDSFMRKITFQELSPEGIRRIGPAVECMAAAEHLDAHRNAMTVRLNHLNL